jgi:hypothetical protein
MFRTAGMALVVSAACSAVPNEPATDPSSTLSETVFRCNVEPVLAKYCSFNACHGITGFNGAGAPLRVYTPGKLRATPPQNLTDLTAATTEAEHHANFLSASGFSFGVASIDDNFLLRKPLPSSLGGYEHKGGAIYADQNDPSYVAIHDWLGGKGACK